MSLFDFFKGKKAPLSVDNMNTETENNVRYTTEYRIKELKRKNSGKLLNFYQKTSTEKNGNKTVSVSIWWNINTNKFTLSYSEECLDVKTNLIAEEADKSITVDRDVFINQHYKSMIKMIETFFNISVRKKYCISADEYNKYIRACADYYNECMKPVIKDNDLHILFDVQNINGSEHGYMVIHKKSGQAYLVQYDFQPYYGDVYGLFKNHIPVTYETVRKSAYEHYIQCESEYKKQIYKHYFEIGNYNWKEFLDRDSSYTFLYSTEDNPAPKYRFLCSLQTVNAEKIQKIINSGTPLNDINLFEIYADSENGMIVFVCKRQIPHGGICTYKIGCYDIISFETLRELIYCDIEYYKSLTDNVKDSNNTDAINDCKRRIKSLRYVIDLYSHEWLKERFNHADVVDAHSEVLTSKEEQIVLLRKKLLAHVGRDNCGCSTYHLGEIYGDKAFKYFDGYSSACFRLDLNTMKIHVELSTYPNMVGVSRSSETLVSAGYFHQIAVECNFSYELQKMENDDDWEAVFDDELIHAVLQKKTVNITEV